MPMKFVISSPFGDVSEVRDFRPHTGIDIPLEVGTKLRSFVDGTVERIVNEAGGLGKGIVVRGRDGNAYTFGHMSKITVHQGQEVHAGRDIIGLSGNSGHSTGPHLHFSVQLPDGSFVDPSPAVKVLESVTGGDPFGQYLGNQPLPGSWLDKLNHLSGVVLGEEKALASDISHPIWTFVRENLIGAGHWILHNLPDLMGYGALLAGVSIILGSMVGKGGYIKPLMIYATMLVIALLLLAGSKGGTE